MKQATTVIDLIASSVWLAGMLIFAYCGYLMARRIRQDAKHAAKIDEEMARGLAIVNRNLHKATKPAWEED